MADENGKPSGKWRMIDMVDELRLHPRFRVKSRANIFGAETWLNHPITNLSVGGACVTVPLPSPVGETIEVEFLDDQQASALSLECTVMWSSTRQMGLKFQCGSDNQEVRRYVNAVRIEVVPDERDR